MADGVKAVTVNYERSVFFSSHKNEWWDLNGKFKTLLKMNSLILEYMKTIMSKQNLIIGNEGFQLPQNLQILDVGCGGGILTEPLARTGSNILGIDVNKSAIEAAQEHAKLDPCLKNLQYKWESIEEHSIHNAEKYDIVILNFVLQHAEKHDVLLKSCIKTLKPGGIIFVSSISKTYEAWIRVIIMGEIIFKYCARGGFNWNSFINLSDVEKILSRDHCYVEDKRGLYFDIFSLSCKWRDNTNGHYVLHAIKHQSQ